MFVQAQRYNEFLISPPEVTQLIRLNISQLTKSATQRYLRTQVNSLIR